MIVYKVEAKHIEAVFPYIEHLLLKPLSRGIGEVTIEHVKEYCKAEQQQLWLGLNEESKNIELAMTTEIITFPSGQRHLIIYLTGAQEHSLENWIHDWSEPIENFCREHKVNYIETHGRDGWLKVLKPMGYKKYYTVQIKEVKYD